HGPICLLACGVEYPLTEHAREDGSNSESQPKTSPVHVASSISFSASTLIRAVAQLTALKITILNSNCAIGFNTGEDTHISSEKRACANGISGK
ncbi:hypothetical protein, partial [Petrachloros mirabilis]